MNFDNIDIPLFESPAPNRFEYNMTEIKCGPDACALSDPVKVLLHQLPMESYHEGQEYRQRKDEIHQSFPIDGTVTLVTRTFTGDRDKARVFWRGCEGFVSAEPRTAEVEEITEVTQRSLKLWF